MPSLKLQPVRRRDFDGLSDDDTPRVVLRQHDVNGNIAVTQAAIRAGGSAQPPNQTTGTASASRSSALADEIVHGSRARPTQEAPSQETTSTLASATSAKVHANQTTNGHVGGLFPCGRRSADVVAPPSVATGADFQHATTTEEKKKLMHDQGRCRPCAFHTTRSEGCRNGLECAFCHLCDKTMHHRVKRKLRKGQASERAPYRHED
eukprot:TRINITY_DN15116_c0_g1_i1.p1 TRINITY_DN15116_c0_g1~~TRINITY_DN15116_c0_g1_i1.p1  ORF type:complete len:236 (+),score=17.10 TRINITY_DN15116_c0_g1_i1:89-709(+)